MQSFGSKFSNGNLGTDKKLPNQTKIELKLISFFLRRSNSFTYEEHRILWLNLPCKWKRKLEFRIERRQSTSPMPAASSSPRIEQFQSFHTNQLNSLFGLWTVCDCKFYFSTFASTLVHQSTCTSVCPFQVHFSCVYLFRICLLKNSLRVSNTCQGFTLLPKLFIMLTVGIFQWFYKWVKPIYFWITRTKWKQYLPNGVNIFFRRMLGSVKDNFTMCYFFSK